MMFRYVAILACLAPIPANAVPTGRPTKVGAIAVTATPKSICVFEWSQGDQQHRYEAWDSCPNMTIRRATPEFMRGVRPQGRDKQTTVADVPPNAPAFVLGNSYSEVLIFVDRHGEVREILTAD